MLVVRRSEVGLNNKVEKGKFFIRDGNLVPRVFHPSLPLGWGDERPWERGCRDGSTEMILVSNKKTVWFI